MPSGLGGLRELFPRAVGVEVLDSGFMLVLFGCLSDVKNICLTVGPLEIGDLLVLFDVAGYECTTAPTGPGTGLSTDKSEGHQSRAECLGLELGLQDGLSAITTVTHAFVKVPEPSIRAQIITRLRRLYGKVKTAFMRYRPARVDEQDRLYAISQGRLTNYPIGEKGMAGFIQQRGMSTKPNRVLLPITHHAHFSY